MSLLGSLIATVIDTASLPVAIVKDVATMGGVLTDRRESYTQEKARNLRDDINDVDDDLRNL